MNDSIVMILMFVGIEKNQLEVPLWSRTEPAFNILIEESGTRPSTHNNLYR